MQARRVLPALAISALALGTLSMPVSAATTRWVDDDGKAGPNGCGGTAQAKATIQDAVIAAHAGDTINVCPGTYPETVNVGAAKDGITIKGVTPWTAKVTGTELTGGEGSALLHIAAGARDVTVRGLSFIWTVPDVVTSGFGSCTLDAGIWIEGRDANILGNRVRAKGETFSPCGMVDAIRVGDPIPPYPTGATPPPSALISHNAVRDFVVHGITAIGPGVTVDIERNSVRYWHLGTVFDTASSPKARTLAAAWSGTRPAGPGFQSLGIAVGDGATGVIYGNEVSSGPNAQFFFGAGAPPDPTPGLFYGIATGDTDGIEIRGNTVRRTFYDISLYGVVNGIVRGNVSVDHGVGILLVDSDDNRVARNQVGPGEWGIVIDADFISGIGDGSQDNRVRENTSFGQDPDCLDDTIGSGTLGTANTWTDNAGLTSYPSGLCEVIN